jgi:hypothetical protein
MAIAKMFLFVVEILHARQMGIGIILVLFFSASDDRMGVNTSTIHIPLAWSERIEALDA